MRVVIGMTAYLSMILAVQAAPPGQTAVGAYEKKTYSYAEWAKGHFSEVVTVSNPAKLIYLSGVNAADEDSKVEVVRNPGDFAAQCRYVWGRIKGMLAKQGATLANVDKAVTYATDPRYLSDNFKCRSEVFAGRTNEVRIESAVRGRPC